MLSPCNSVYSALGNLVARDEELQNLDVKQVKDAFQDENSPLAKKLISGLSYYGSSIKRGPSYFKSKECLYSSGLKIDIIRHSTFKKSNIFFLHGYSIQNLPNSHKTFI